ncbi:MAG: hypothetical protein NTZ73_03945 [Candidatus Diapherotrites archaeon]|nr:hypothetical protein [Candidatus Diapherotrites archaeon]
MDDLSFSQKFPFTEKARAILKKSNISIQSAPPEAVKKAALMVSRAAAGKQYLLEMNNPSEEILSHEIIAFPVAKMFVSAMSQPRIAEKFSMMIERNTFSHLSAAKNPRKLSIDLAEELGVKFLLAEKKEFFVEVPLLEYLKINFNDEELKLVNQSVLCGKVFLNGMDFARFLSEIAYKKVFDSLPIAGEDISREFKQMARSIETQIGSIERKEFDLKVSGKINPNFFPPCMKALYSDLAAGKKLSYAARVTVASFLYKVGFTQEELTALFAKSPDYKPHIARYHILRIFEKKLSAPGCKKIKEYGLKVKGCEQECGENHPLQYYMRKLRQSRRIAESPKPEKEISKAWSGGK